MRTPALNFFRPYYINKKETIITSGIIVSVLALYVIFPAENPFQQIVSSLAFLLAVPLLYVKIVLKKNLRNFGWQLGDWQKGARWAGFSLFISLLIFYVIFHYTNFRQKYSLPQIVSENFWFFLGYEILLVGLFVVFYEFFFRGFVLFSFRWLKYWSIIIQFCLFVCLLLIMKNFEWLMFHYIITAFFSGLIAYQSRSIFYSIVFSWVFIIITDAIFIKISS